MVVGPSVRAFLQEKLPVQSTISRILSRCAIPQKNPAFTGIALCTAYNTTDTGQSTEYSAQLNNGVQQTAAALHATKALLNLFMLIASQAQEHCTFCDFCHHQLERQDLYI